MWSTPKRTCKATSCKAYSALLKPLLIFTMMLTRDALGYDIRLANLCHSKDLSVLFKFTVSDIFELYWLYLCQIIIFLPFLRNKFN